MITNGYWVLKPYEVSAVNTFYRQGNEEYKWTEKRHVQSHEPMVGIENYYFIHSSWMFTSLLFSQSEFWKYMYLSRLSQRRQCHPTPVLFPGKSDGRRSLVGCSPWGFGVGHDWVEVGNFTFTFHFHALEKEMATHSSVLAWRIPGMGEPGGLPSMGSCRVRHDWSDSTAAAHACPEN